MTVRRVVVDHVLLIVQDLAASRRFYQAALAPLGIQELRVESDGVAFGAEGMDDFAVFAGRQPTTGAHVAFDAPSREAVDAFYVAALEHGGRHRGAPGVWVQYSERYYAAFVWDPQGNNIEAVFHSPESLVAVAPTRQPQDASSTSGTRSRTPPTRLDNDPTDQGPTRRSRDATQRPKREGYP